VNNKLQSYRPGICPHSVNRPKFEPVTFNTKPTTIKSWIKSSATSFGAYIALRNDAVILARLHTVGDRRTNENGALMEWFWRGKTEALG